MMHQDNSRNEHGAAVRSLAVYSIWHVEADASYDVPVGPWHWKRLIIIRTLAGEGELTLARGGVVRVPAGSLVLVVGSGLKRYRCLGAQWEFWWLEVDVLEPPALPLNAVLALPAVSVWPVADRRAPAQAAGAELSLLELAMNSLRRESPAQEAVAAAAVQLLLHHWQAQWAGTLRTTPQQAAVERVIEQMHQDLTGGLTLKRMAAAAHLSEPHFRRVFKAVTGQAPKPYYDGLRLERARQLLAQRQLNVGEAAAALGFSSPFHLSRAYKKHFGHPPSHRPGA